jgi:hypothetical protein
MTVKKLMITIAGTLLLACSAPALTADALSSPLWLRYPAVAPDGSRIAFSYGGQL